MIISLEHKKCVFSYILSKRKSILLYRIPQITQIKIESFLRKDCANLICYATGSLFMQLGFLPSVKPFGRFFTFDLAISQHFDEFLLNFFFIFLNFKNMCVFQFFNLTQGVFESIVKNFLHFFFINNAYNSFSTWNLDLPLKLKMQTNSVNKKFKKQSIFNYLNFQGFIFFKRIRQY